MSDLKGAVAVVSGASRRRGIGRAVALRLAARGATVVVCSRPQSEPPSHNGDAGGWAGIRSVAAEIEANGGKAAAIPCDVTDPQQVRYLIEETIRRFGGLNILVNNAGAADSANLHPIVELDEQVWDKGINVNLRAAYLMTKAALPAMISARTGAIVNVSSLAGRQGYANYGAYCAAKFGLIGLTQQVAREVGKHGVRVNCVCPGGADTDMLHETIEQAAMRRNVSVEVIRQEVAAIAALRRLGAPDEFAAAIAFLAGPEASYVTGQTLNVDGGIRMD